MTRRPNVAPVLDFGVGKQGGIAGLEAGFAAKLRAAQWPLSMISQNDIVVVDQGSRVLRKRNSVLVIETRPRPGRLRSVASIMNSPSAGGSRSIFAIVRP